MTATSDPAGTAGGTLAGIHVVRQEGDGSAPTVVAVHGGMDRASSFGRVARQLADVALVRYDRRGYGGSVEAGPAPLDRHVDDLLAIIDGEPVVVFGHSLGGLIALAAAERRPDVVTAVLSFEAPTPWAPWWPGGRSAPEGEPLDPAEEAERFMRRMVGDRIWERLPARTRAARRSEGVALRADLSGLREGQLDLDLAAITVPVLCGAGSETTWWYRRGVEELADQLPQGELIVVEGASHGVHLTHPVEAADHVRRLRALVDPVEIPR